MPSSSNVPASGNQDIDGLLSGLKWDTNSLTYSFPDTASFYGYPGERDDNFEALNSTQIAAVQQILTLYTSVANLSFSMITETETVHADLRFAMSDEPSTAWAYYPSAGEWGGDSWYNNTSGDYDNPLRGTYAYHTFLHEIGHALGLKHGHETDTYGALPANHDSQEYSVMTYRSYVGSPGSYYSVYEGEGVQTLMMNDIAALQYMHGANFTTNSSNTIYTWSSTTGEMFINSVGQGANTENTIFATIWDGGGIDTYDLSNYSGGVSIDLRPGEWTTVSSAQLSTLGYDDGLGGEVYARGNIANALLYQGNVASLIENAFGGDGADTITGNQAANLLLGNGGADTIDGREGNDLIYAGEGIDTVHGGDNDDRIDGAGGNDTLHGDAGADLITGGAGDDTIYGGADTDTFLLGEAGMDTIHGDDGDDRIDGGADNDTLYGDAGADRITGGLGDDTIYGGEGDDQFLLGEGGSDTIYGGLGVDFLGGGADNDFLYGEGGNDAITGGLGNDTIEGGADNDSLYGEDGNDTIHGGDGSDLIAGGLGDDILLAGDAGSDNILGGDGNDTLDGGGDNDFLYGEGGADTIHGGDGADFIAGGNDSDTLLAGDAGNDTIFGGAGDDIIDGGGDNDVLYGEAGNDTISGGAGSDQIYSGGDNDTIDGGGDADYILAGLGNDIIDGGTGNDTIFGEGGTDTFKFSDGWGHDTIRDWLNGTEQLDVSAVTGLDNFGQLTIYNIAGGVQIYFGGNTITLSGWNTTHIDASDFIF